MNEDLKEAIMLFEDVLVHGTERVLKHVDAAVWKEHSPEQIRLMKIIESYGPVPSGRLAELQGVHKSAISNRLKKLTEKGLVIIERTEGDQRTKLVLLTDAGREVVQASDEAIYQYLKKLIDGQFSEGEAEEFVRIFRRLKEILKLEEV
ncbi:MarR family winged helix-turn-helix transcriptional regulator [Exiguobacterium flavidum]|uniref:MarR family winged helix-turn-helix transcriptional regulator n=1 Tax=Exiguobacterium flavidum TaxID=2184695 RepID=UPI000DF72567|nr:MarR family transcriptional regulator [Exiguobacterium flavidum]